MTKYIALIIQMNDRPYWIGPFKSHKACAQAATKLMNDPANNIGSVEIYNSKPAT